MMLGIALALLFVAMMLALYRGIRGPEAHDRVLAANAFGSITVLSITLLAFKVDDMLFLDIALVYALINFLTTVALLKYFRHGHIGKHPHRSNKP